VLLDGLDSEDPRLSWSVSTSVSMRYNVRASGPLLGLGNQELLAGGPVPGRRFAVCDDGVPASWRESLARYFDHHGVDARILVVEGGEQCKRPEVLFQIIAEFEEFGLVRRNEPVLIVGGGALMDAASLAAAIYRRGVPFIKVPTTLLAYVDASIGIKTAINFNNRKNLVGSFSAPLVVLLDRGFFRTLPSREISSGLSEILKLGIGCDEALFHHLEALAPEVVFRDKFQSQGGTVLARAIDVMIRELEPNIHEDNLCRAVDLGHTFSQVFEMSFDKDALRHGEAVALDLNLSCIVANRRGLLDDDALRRVAVLTETLGLPTKVPEVDPGELWRSVAERTRHRGGLQRVPLPRRLGENVFVNNLTFAEVGNAYDRLLNQHWR
jgi:3-dehydroquinate synthetase